jgi:hypothetical protein
MSVIVIHRASFLSADYIAEENGVLVAKINRSRWRNGAELTVQERVMRLKRHGFITGTFTLYDADTPVFEVIQPGAWRASSRLMFTFENNEYEIVNNRSILATKMLIKSRGSVVGSIKTKGILWSTGVKIDMPPSFPIALRVFLGWLAMIRFNETSSAYALAT